MYTFALVVCSRGTRHPAERVEQHPDASCAPALMYKVIACSAHLDCCPANPNHLMMITHFFIHKL